jgi:hypothetical protein
MGTGALTGIIQHLTTVTILDKLALMNGNDEEQEE